MTVRPEFAVQTLFPRELTNISKSTTAMQVKLDQQTFSLMLFAHNLCYPHSNDRGRLGG